MWAVPKIRSGISIAWLMGCSKMELPRFMELSLRRGSQRDLHINRLIDALIDTA